MLRLFALIAVTIGSAIGTEWTTQSVNVKYGLSPTGVGSTEFIQMPLYLDNATEKGWVVMQRPASPEGLSSLELCCPSDNHEVCPMYDDTGFIAGLQFAFDKDFVSDAVYEWKTQGFTEWNVTLTNGTVKSYWTQQQYYISPDALKTDPAARIASRNSTTVLQEGQILVPGFNGVLFKILTDIEYVNGSDSNFTKQGCFLWMGRHYYLNMSQSLECSSDTVFPWFILIDDGKFVALGIGIYAKYNAESVWLERATRSLVEWNVPNAPDCIYTLADDPGVLTLHTYFIPSALSINCDGNE